MNYRKDKYGNDISILGMDVCALPRAAERFSWKKRKKKS